MTTKLRECLGLKTVAAGRPNTSPDYIAGASDQHHADEKALWKALESVEPTAEVSVDIQTFRDKWEGANTHNNSICTPVMDEMVQDIEALIQSHTTALKGRVVDGIDEVVDMLDAQGHISPQHSVDEVKSKLKTFITNIT